MIIIIHNSANIGIFIGFGKKNKNCFQVLQVVESLRLYLGFSAYNIIRCRQNWHQMARTPCPLTLLQYAFQQECSILITRHSGRYFISIGNVFCQFYFETIIIEVPRMLLTHLGKLQIMGGYHAADGQMRDIIQKQTRAVELI